MMALIYIYISLFPHPECLFGVCWPCRQLDLSVLSNQRFTQYGLFLYLFTHIQPLFIQDWR